MKKFCLLYNVATHGPMVVKVSRIATLRPLVVNEACDGWNFLVGLESGDYITVALMIVNDDDEVERDPVRALEQAMSIIGLA